MSIFEGLSLRRRRLPELTVWIVIGVVVAGRFLIWWAEGGNVLKTLSEYYIELLFALLLCIFPFLFELTFGLLPFEYVRLTRRARRLLESQRDASPTEPLQTSTSQSSADAPQNDGSQGLDNLIPRTASLVERALGSYAEASGRIANGLYTRAGIYLIVGVLIAFSGLFFFYVQTNAMQQQELKRQELNLAIATKAAAPKVGADESAGTLLLSRVAELAPRFGILFFIEFVAFFFLRQYRSAMDEFRYFEAVKRCREEVFALILLSKEVSTIDLAKVVESGRFFSSAGKLAAGETTELIETRKLTKDEMALFEQIVTLISSSKRTT
jgi:hypothetical protein